MSDVSLKKYVSFFFYLISLQRTDEQKLIYSGQLLQDGVVLKDVLRQYEGQQTHTVHLVYVPKHQKLGIMKKEDKKELPSQTRAASNGETTPATDASGLRWVFFLAFYVFSATVA